MEVIFAEHGGFCRGVKNALDITLREVSAGKKVTTLGPLVHNDKVTDFLSSIGVTFAAKPDELGGGTVVIRTHGASPDLLEFLQGNKDLEIIDATCPFVSRVQLLANSYAQKEYHVLIYGDIHHPEVQALIGWAGKMVTIIDPESGIPNNITSSSKTVFISQTTQREEKFSEAAEALKKICPELEIHNTICKATMLRQEAAANLASRVDLMLVVGDAQSSNTRKLTQVCREIAKTYQITGAGDISGDWLVGIKKVGVTAGASTPPWTIKEVMVKMENGNLEARTDDVSTEKEGKEYQPGDVITGKVVSIQDDQVLLDIGQKSEAVLPKGEVFLEGEAVLKDKFSEGEDLDLLVLKIDQEDDNIIVSIKRLERERRWKELEEAVESGLTMQGKVKEVVPAGIIIDLSSGIEGFMPGSLVDVRYIPDFQTFLNQDFSFKVIELNRERDKVILSRKQMLKEDMEQQKKETIEGLNVGQIMTGTVKRLTDFGAFVDVGGIDGLVHISEVSWQRVEHPQDVLKVGEQVDVKVLEVIPERERISLSIRQALPDPWSKMSNEFQVGENIKGKVTRIVNFGAFVEIMPGVEGLVHISQMADFHVKHPSEIIKEGEEVEAKILDINIDNKRISLSIKKARPAPKDYSAHNVQAEAENQNVTLGDIFGGLFKDKNNSTEDEE
ncbi:MAG: bifunctional 4-hydroxy-3-methylbut-2-enyl diphosphate reductase/30S ribosomal protein S1 [Bacillota bacterium]|nr:bifunctional 4-hydroxy-3-methylbut-2-enyl diphosphate reductase/30S ribosomal protein S1 [Bacillota bacterium]